jgi:hypothetical protein
MQKNSPNPILNLNAGELVEVRSREEILATLDESGKYETMPFMPEMLSYCGQRLRVSKRAHKTCDTVEWTGIRRLENSVHLEGSRCDGAAHDGCQAGCTLFWKEAWLKRVNANLVSASSLTAKPTNGGAPQACTADTLFRQVRQDVPGEEIYSCQATELRNFTKFHSKYDIRHYLWDLRAGNVTFFQVFVTILISRFNWLQSLRNGRRIPHIEGNLDKTPVLQLDLQPGELVRVKPHQEILKTLNRAEKNRGLSYDSEMVKCCGKVYRVLRRVRHIINEKTGKMMKMGSDCIILEGVTCDGKYHKLCPRGIYPYWREIWLERVGVEEAAAPVVAVPSCVSAGKCE